MAPITANSLLLSTISLQNVMLHITLKSQLIMLKDVRERERVPSANLVSGPVRLLLRNDDTEKARTLAGFPVILGQIVGAW